MVACTADTNSVDLGFDGTNNLTADVRLRTLADGSLTTTVDGVGFKADPAGGIIGSAAGGLIKVAQGLYVGTEGLMKVNGYARAGNPGPSNATSPNLSITRGAQAQVGSTLSLVGSLPSNELGSYVMAHGRWRGDWSTNYSEVGAASLLDSVYAYLQFQADGGGWQTYDQASLARYNMGCSFVLDAWYPAFMANGTSHQLDLRLVIAGGVASGTAQQGVIRTEYGSCLEWIY